MSAPDRGPAALADRLVVADLFARLGVAYHREWPVDATRDFADPGACELCRAGWCVQRVVLTPGRAAVVVHGLALH